MFLFKRKKSPSIDIGIINENTLNLVTDFTMLSPFTSIRTLEDFLCVAHKKKYYSVCVNPVNVKFAKEYITSKLKSDMKVCCVVGFPLGETSSEVKAFEAKRAIADGADEIDMVMSISRAKSGDWKYVKNDISRVVRVCHGRIVKVIIESCYLNKYEIQKACNCIMHAKADFVKTSTGYGDNGATPEVVEIIKEEVKNKCGIKASGGIATKTEALNLIRMGATRIGTSRVLK